MVFGSRGVAAMPEGGGRARPGFETTRRAQLAARPASGRTAACRHIQQPHNRKAGHVAAVYLARRPAEATASTLEDTHSIDATPEPHKCFT